jgi:hypothetical protein
MAWSHSARSRPTFPRSCDACLAKPPRQACREIVAITARSIEQPESAVEDTPPYIDRDARLYTLDLEHELAWYMQNGMVVTPRPVDQICKTYTRGRGAVVAVDGVSFTVQPGEFRDAAGSQRVREVDAPAHRGRTPRTVLRSASSSALRPAGDPSRRWCSRISR